MQQVFCDPWRWFDWSCIGNLPLSYGLNGMSKTLLSLRSTADNQCWHAGSCESGKFAAKLCSQRPSRPYKVILSPLAGEVASRTSGGINKKSGASAGSGTPCIMDQISDMSSTEEGSNHNWWSGLAELLTESVRNPLVRALLVNADCNASLPKRSEFSKL
jgi:hypothetical protein